MSIAKPMPGTLNGTKANGTKANGTKANETKAEATPNVLARLLAPIEQELAAVSQRLQTELRHVDPFIDELAQHSFRLGGKRLRPALLLLTAQAVGEVNDSHRVLAAVVEMVHTATLVHDDVLDEADIRRHEATVNARWNNQTSVLLGDYLFTHAFYLASTLETTFGCRAIGRATNIVCEGELKQTAASGDFELSRETYFEIIAAKTAELCACCCRLGAHYSGANDSGANDSMAKRLESYGRHLGIAFQIADDLLDLEGEEQVTGKSLGTDLNNRKMTLPLIHLRDQLDRDQQQELRQLIDQPSAESFVKLLDWLETSGSLQHARDVADGHVAQAIANLTDLPASPALASLQHMAQFVTRRDR